MTFFEILSLLISKIESEWGIELWEVEEICLSIYPRMVEVRRQDNGHLTGRTIGRTIYLGFSGEAGLGGEVKLSQ